MRVAIALGKAVRNLSTRRFTTFLQDLKPSMVPPLFRRHVKGWKGPEGSGAATIFATIFMHVTRERGARHNGQRSASPRRPGRQSYPEYIEYSSDRIRFRIGRNHEDGFNSESIYHLAIPNKPGDSDTDEDTRNKEQHDFRSPLDAANKLGVHPAELGSQFKIRSEVPCAQSRGQARQIARARGRSVEIDRTLMPWSSDRLEFAPPAVEVLP